MSLSIFRQNRALSLGLTTLSLLCCTPHDVCYANDFHNLDLIQPLTHPTQLNDPEAFVKDLRQSIESLSHNDDPIVGIREFLRNLVSHINANSSRHMTMSDLCRSLRENLGLFQLPPEEHKALTVCLEIIENEKGTFESSIEPLIACIHPDFFILAPVHPIGFFAWLYRYFENKAEKKERKKQEQKFQTCLSNLKIGVKETVIVLALIGLGFTAIYFCPQSAPEIIETITSKVIPILVA